MPFNGLIYSVKCVTFINLLGVAQGACSSFVSQNPSPDLSIYIYIYIYCRFTVRFPIGLKIIFDCLRMVGILLSMYHVLSNVSNHLCAIGPRFFSGSTGTSSLPVVFLSLSNTTRLFYS